MLPHELSIKLRKRYKKEVVKLIDKKIEEIKKKIYKEEHSPSLEACGWWIGSWEEQVKLLEKLREEIKNGETKDNMDS